MRPATQYTALLISEADGPPILCVLVPQDQLAGAGLARVQDQAEYYRQTVQEFAPTVIETCDGVVDILTELNMAADEEPPVAAEPADA
jgi:hypothetical protein